MRQRDLSVGGGGGVNCTNCFSLYDISMYNKPLCGWGGRGGGRGRESLLSVLSVCLSLSMQSSYCTSVCFSACLPALLHCLSVCSSVLYMSLRRETRVCPTQHLVVYIIKINESVSDCLAPGPRKRENLLYPSGGAGGPAIPLPHPSRQSSYL